jgi:hypothetical protein
MDWKEVGAVLAKVGLPLLGAALPLPGGAAIGAALASAIGSPDATPESILNTLTASEEARAKAVEFQLTHQREMSAMVLQHRAAMYETEVGDRKDARKASVEGGNAQRTFWFCVLVFVSVIGIEATVLLNGLPPGVDPASAGRILGTLDAALMCALYFLLGSSSGSQRKTDDLMARAKEAA